MSKIGKIAVLIALAGAVGTVIAIKTVTSAEPLHQPATTSAPATLPRLVDLGSTMCIPCRAMTPVLEELKAEYTGRMQVQFIDVQTDPQAAKPFGIKLIPTQVFLDASGKELWRHEGVLSKQDILAKWKELGVTFSSASSAPTQPAGSDSTTTSRQAETRAAQGVQ